MTGTLGAPAESERMELTPVREGETVADKYVIGHVLGVGGMGVVVAATDRVLERRVAIKFLLPSLASSEKAVQRFIREARLATRITSEHVVRLLEIDTLPNGTPFFAMEYLEGRDLRAMMAERGPLPSIEAVDYVMQALEAVAEGHHHGVIHRDLKPSNLFVTHRADGSPLVKVLDFGIAKSAEPEGAYEGALTGSGDTRLGSPSYMSPEQLRSPSDVDARSDVWALGVTLYELLCGSPPFTGKTYADLVLAITTSDPVPPSKLRPELELPPGLDPVIRICLAREAVNRYSSALELAIVLSPFGSFDARTSLRRIRGLTTTGTVHGVSTPRRPASGPSTARDTPRPISDSSTLPVAMGPMSGDTRRSPVVPLARVPPSRRPVVLGVLLGLVALGGFGWLGHSILTAEDERAAGAPARLVEPAAPAVSAPRVEAASVPAVAGPIATSAPPIADSTARGSAPQVPVPAEPADSDASRRLTKLSHREAAPASSATSAALAPSAVPTVSPDPAASAAPAELTAAPPPSGRSLSIERLIQSRR
ncbi:MAG TPA: protein kinase [Polyangiaceae bacterium]